MKIIDSPITDRVWSTELDRMVRSPVWPLLAGWFEQQLVRRVMAADDPLQAAVVAQADLRGARALLLAMENELTGTVEGVIDGRRNNGRRPGATGRRVEAAAGAAGGARAALTQDNPAGW